MGNQQQTAKRALALLIAALLTLVPLCAFAEAEETRDPNTRDQPIPLSTAEQQTDDAADEPEEPSQEASTESSTEFDDSVLNENMTVVLMDADTGEILYERDADKIIYPASTTKIMTGLLAIELNGGNLDGEIRCGPEVNEFSRTSSLLGLKEDYTVSMQDLVYGLMLVSGNDAAAAIAVHFSGSVDNFVELMNQKAQELGMTNTLFSNPHGLDQRSLGIDHHSTAADMAKLARAAYQNPILMQVMGTPSYEITTTELNGNIRSSQELHNGNYLLETPVQEPQRSRYAQFRYQPTTGMKTGLLQNVDGFRYYGCLVASASRDGRNLIAAIFADTSDYGEDGPALDRWRAAIALFEFGFMGFVDVDITPYIASFQTQTTVAGAASNDPGNGILVITPGQDTASPSIISLARKDALAVADGTTELNLVPQLNEGITAPVTAGQTLGTVSCQVNGQEVLSLPLVASRSVYAAGDEEVTSQHYGVPDPSSSQLWLWVAVIGGAAAAIVIVYLILQRRRYRGRYIGKHRRGRIRYPRSWNDDVPLSALRTPKNDHIDYPRRKHRR